MLARKRVHYEHDYIRALFYNNLLENFRWLIRKLGVYSEDAISKFRKR